MVSNLCKHLVEFCLPASRRRLTRETATMPQYDTPYRVVKTKGANTGAFILAADPEALQALRTRHGNRDMKISIAFYESADPSSRCLYGLCFHVRSSTLEQARRSALEAVQFLGEKCGIQEECIDLIYDGGGIVPEEDNQHGYPHGRNDQTAAGTATPAEIVLLVPPSIFNSQPTPHALIITYDLARQMRDQGIQNLDFDCYVRDHYVVLPDSIDGATGRFIVRVSPRELLYLSPRGIFDLSKQARGDDCLAAGHPVPEAADWFAEVLGEKETQARHQAQLREHLLRLGWTVPPCIRRLDWAEMSDDNALEACRIIAGFYPFVGAGQDEVWYHIHRIGRRHGLGQGAQLRAIVTSGNENPAFVGCEHLLLRQFCPTGGCRMREVIAELKCPRLFT